MEFRKWTTWTGREKPLFKHGIPTRFVILAVVAVFVIPGIVFSGFLLARYAEAERMKYELMGQGVANAVSSVLDEHLASLRTTLQTLSTSPLIESEDWEAFHRQALQVKSIMNAHIGLRSPDGNRILTTRLPWGAPLPATPLPFETSHSAVAPFASNVYVGDVSEVPQIAMVTPVIIDGKTRYLLDISVGTDVLLDLVKSVTPPDWIVGVGDRLGTYVLRTEDHEKFTGKPGVPAFLARAQGRQGTFTGESAFGEEIQVSYRRTAVSDWLVAANIRQSVLQAPLYSALKMLAGFGLVALLGMSIAALTLWGYVSRPLSSLAEASRNIGTSKANFSIGTSLQEFVALRDALDTASEEVRLNKVLLETRVAERTRALREANEELQAEIEARKDAESQLRQIQKMEAVGQLTGGIAHDFNNMLSVIISSLNLFEKRHKRGDKDAFKFIASAKDGANRAANLTKRLLAFSRQQPLEPSVVQLNQVVGGMSEMLQRTLGDTISVETVLGAGLWKTHVDATQVENALLNLAVNARDAMPDGGKLTIETANCFLDEEYTRNHRELPVGQYVMIAVTDTGTGMPQEVLDKAFDPFFTTKGPGLGTGLGLSQVYGFVKQSQGHIKIYSEAGEGTSVKIYLPRNTSDEPAAEKRSRRIPSSLAGSKDQIIIVVEDNEDLRHLTVSLLEEIGYSVLNAETPLAALATIRERADISLLFTDIVMPEMSGRKLADAVAAFRPELPVLFTTGFTRNAVVHNGVLDSGVNFIAKPFSLEELAAKVRASLEENA